MLRRSLEGGTMRFVRWHLRTLVFFTGATLIYSAQYLTSPLLFGSPITWRTLYWMAGASLLAVPVTSRFKFRLAVIGAAAVLSIVAMVGRSVSLLMTVASQMLEAQDVNSSLIIGGLVWALVAGYTVTVIAFWPSIERMGQE